MENLVSDDDRHYSDNCLILTSQSYSNYRTAIASSSSSAAFHHPPSFTTPAGTDPLLFPPPPPNPPNTSYSDVVFSPIEADSAGDSEKSPSFSKYSSSSSDYLEIHVTHPQKQAESSSNSIIPGNKTYITYLITTKTNISDYGDSHFRVRRRFRDVVNLSDKLSEVYRGFLIPVRPEKSIVESQVMKKQQFVGRRRVLLEKYLRRLAVHPVIKKSDELRVFLKVQGRLDGGAKLPKQLFGDSRREAVMGSQEVVENGKGGRDLLRLFKEFKQSVANDFRPPVVEEDKEFLEKKGWFRDLEQQLSNASKQAESLVKAQQGLGDTMGELGLALVKLTKFENQAAILNTQRVRAADMKNLANSAIKAGRYHRGLNAQTVKHLDTLHEYLELMLAVHNAFSERSSALLTVQTFLSELSSLHSRSEKLETVSSKIFGGDKSRIRKSEELKEYVRVTENAKSCAIREYERIKENNKSEIERLDRERQTDFVNMLRGFVTNQVAYMDKIGNEWTKVAEQTNRYSKETA